MVPDGGRCGGGGGLTDNKAFPSLALSFELGLRMAIVNKVIETFDEWEKKK